jgi:hypothetical protein
MVLVRNRRSEQRENPIAGGLHDVAAIAMDRIDHQLECWVDNRPGLFRVKVLHQLHRPFDIGEQRRYGLALAICDIRCGLLGR